MKWNSQRFFLALSVVLMSPRDAEKKGDQRPSGEEDSRLICHGEGGWFKSVAGGVPATQI